MYREVMAVEEKTWKSVCSGMRQFGKGLCAPCWYSKGFNISWPLWVCPCLDAAEQRAGSPCCAGRRLWQQGTGALGWLLWKVWQPWHTQSVRGCGVGAGSSVLWPRYAALSWAWEQNVSNRDACQLQWLYCRGNAELDLTAGPESALCCTDV